MNRLEMLKWIHETLGDFKDPATSNSITPSNWQWSNGLFRSAIPDYQSIYRSDYLDYVERLKIQESHK